MQIIKSLPARQLRYAIICLLLIPVSGCLVLPIPNSRVEGFGVQSQIIDAETNQPVVNAKIRALDNGKTVTSDAEGRFDLPPRVQWHLAYFYAPISFPILPFTGDIVDLCRDIRVEANGYTSKEFLLGVGKDRNLSESKNEVLIESPLRIERKDKASTVPTDSTK